MSETSPPPEAPSEPATVARTKKPVVVGAAGLAAGVLIGLALGLFVIPTLGDSPATDELSPIVLAADACGTDRVSGITLGDDGRSITMDSEGEESSGASLDDVACVLRELDVPDSVISKFDSTRALDGGQQATWDDLDASWTYHPDDGLDIVIELSGR